MLCTHRTSRRYRLQNASFRLKYSEGSKGEVTNIMNSGADEAITSQDRADDYVASLEKQVRELTAQLEAAKSLQASYQAMS